MTYQTMLSRGKKYYRDKQFVLRFDNEKLTEVTIFNDKKVEFAIYYNEMTSSSKKGLLSY